MTEHVSGSILRFEDVSLFFDEEPALDHVSFDLQAGETRIIFGAAGSGKSVLLKTALGLLKPDSGKIFLFGEDVTTFKEDDLYSIRGKIGVLFQEGGLFDSFNIEENVSYPLINSAGRPTRYTEQEAAKVHEALRFVELEHTLEKFPSELSGGMRRRVGIARAAVTQPPLMLYDSPTAGLDPITANTIIALIVKARDTSNTTSAIVTHRYQDGHLIANFRYNPQSGQLEPAGREAAGIHERTKFMVFQRGRLVFEGTEEELEEQSDEYVSRFKWRKN
ncbi:MAG TPA: ATP-binding cassette domain-containing protein [Bryobacteraceae bacterium]|nr:ATP-binding cassette domain-containing protein [Bryobacteraceae bacterium]